MKYLLAPAAVALAIGTISVPAKAQSIADAFAYVDSGNFIENIVSVEANNSEDLRAEGGQVDKGVHGGTVFLCDSRKRSDAFNIEISDGKIEIKLRSDNGSKNPKHCHDPLQRNEIDETTCPNSGGAFICDVTSFFTQSGTSGVTVIVASDQNQPPAVKTKGNLMNNLKKSLPK